MNTVYLKKGMRVTHVDETFACSGTVVDVVDLNSAMVLWDATDEGGSNEPDLVLKSDLNIRGGKMNARQQTWVDDLRSGRYVQGKSTLRQHDGVKNVDLDCCLGVACVRAKEHGIVKSITLSSDRVADSTNFQYYFFTSVDPMASEDDDHGGYLPHDVVAWLGLKDEKGTFHKHLADFSALTEESGIEGERYLSLIDWIAAATLDLASLNDANFNFLQIAQFIEDNAHLLFTEESMQHD